MNAKTTPKKRTAKPIHPVRRYFRNKVEKRAKEAFDKKRAGEENRLKPREELAILIYDFVEKKRRERGSNGVNISEEKAVEIIERHAKMICRERGLEPSEKD